MNGASATGTGASGQWQVPLRIRAGAGAPRTVLLDTQEQKIAAGSCDEALSVNADAVGYYRVQYDADTLAANTRAFPGAVDGDRIALLDDQWASVGSGDASLQTFLAWHPPWAPTATHGPGSRSSERSRSLNTPSADRPGISLSRRMRVR